MTRQDSSDILYKYVNHLDEKTLRRINKKKGFKYGYNEEYEFVSISNNGQIGQFITIQGLTIGLPTQFEVHERSKIKTEQYWERIAVPHEKEISKIQNFQEYKRKAHLHETIEPYIDQEFNRRYDGFWFMNNGEATYITGTNYFFLQWANIDSDSGWADYRDCNRIFHYFWEACKADSRSYGMCYLKNRRSGFSFMAGSETVHTATMTRDRNFGILSKSGADAKEFFIGKTVRISRKLPFFFRPVQSGMDNPKTSLEYKEPAVKLTKRSYTEQADEALDLDSLDTTIEWKNTGSNAFDGYKLRLLVHDESAKWEKPHDLKKNWGVTKTCLRVGSKVIGKCMMGSTCNRLDTGGQEFKDIYDNSNLTSAGRNQNGQTSTGLYSLFIPMQFNYQGFIDRYGFSVLRTPEAPVEGVDGEMINQGILDYWENEVEGLKDSGDELNEFYRQNPKFESHAFRDKQDKSLFNLGKIYEQKEHNDELGNNLEVSTGRFQWRDGVIDTEVIFHPDPNGRFRLGWVPPVALQNNMTIKNGMFYPGNKELGAFGCDSYDVSGVVFGSGSNGALHGLTSYSMNPNVPSNEFFLEYIAKPQTAEIFFEEVLMACVFYGMPILAENNKIRLLAHFKKRGYRKFSMDRPDKLRSKLKGPELEFGGIPNSSVSVIQAHAAAIESYIENYIGSNEKGEFPYFPFNKTLTDWSRFDIANRTKYDATISSGLAIMANNRHLLYPRADEIKTKVFLPFNTYNNEGKSSILNKK